MRAVLVLAGGALIAFGSLFALQGAGIVHWPAESFMLGKSDWIEYGIVVALIGVALALSALRIGR
jgi:hypothetical protein